MALAACLRRRLATSGAASAAAAAPSHPPPSAPGCERPSKAARPLLLIAWTWTLAARSRRMR